MTLLTVLINYLWNNRKFRVSPIDNHKKKLESFGNWKWKDFLKVENKQMNNRVYKNYIIVIKKECDFRFVRDISNNNGDVVCHIQGLFRK